MKLLFVPVLFLLLRMWTTIFDWTVYSSYDANDPYKNLASNGAAVLVILGVSYTHVLVRTPILTHDHQVKIT